MQMKGVDSKYTCLDMWIEGINTKYTCLEMQSEGLDTIYRVFHDLWTLPQEVIS